MLPGYCALMRAGQVIWVGKLGAPIEDVEFDGVIVHPDDYQRIKAAFPE
jgi:hypothetical protein